MTAIKQSQLLRFLLLCLLASVFGMTQTANAQINPSKDWWSAIKRDDGNTVQQMLVRGIDPGAFNELGNPALTQAAREQSWEVFDILSQSSQVAIDQANALDETALMYLAILGQSARAEKLIKAGARVNRLGWTPLHYAASRGQLDMAKMLIAQHAIINAPGPDGASPLMMAALSGNRVMVGYLLEQGADPNMIDAKQATAADWARQNGNVSTAKLLDQAAARARAQVHAQPQDAPTPDTTTKPEEGSAASDESSFSRYFDLDRFEQD